MVAVHPLVSATPCTDVPGAHAPADPGRGQLGPITGSTAPDVRIDVVHDLAPLRDEWIRLAGDGENVFATWEWQSTWWRHFGGRARLDVITVRDGQRLIGLLPLYRWTRRPLTVLRFVGHGTSDELGAVCAPQDRPVVLAAARRALATMRWQLLLAEHVAPHPEWDELLDGRKLRPQGSPVVRFGGLDWDGYLATRSRNLRGQVRQRRRALDREGRSRFRLITDERELPGAMATLFRLHAMRWPQGSEFLRQQAFHRDFARTALRRGWLRLWILERDGEAVAATYGFRYGQVENYYQAGRDAAHDQRSVGFVLLAHALEQAVGDGVGEYQLLRGREPYKYRFATCDPTVETIAVGRSAAVRRALPLLAAIGSDDHRLATTGRRLAARYLG